MGIFDRIKEMFTGVETEEKEDETIYNEKDIGEQQEAEQSILKEEKLVDTIEEKTHYDNKEKDIQKSTLKKITVEEIEAVDDNKPVIDILKTIPDPELQIDIWTLGLIYNIETTMDEVDGSKNVHVLMTFTSIMCPVGPMIVQQVESGLKKNTNIKNVKVEVVFDPPWQPTEELREMLGV